jgi:Ulp1 family protease
MDEEVELSYNNIALRKSDINTFKEYTQLNDLSISFYFEILNEKFAKFNNEFTLLDPATVFLLVFETDLEDLVAMLKPLKLHTKQYIFIPVNDIDSKFRVAGGNHWALLIYQKCDQTFYYIDSMLSFIKNTNIIVKNLCEILEIKQIAEVICFDEEKHQQNTYDCGMFVLSYAETFLNKLNSENFNHKLSKCVLKEILKGHSQKIISVKRKEILNLITSLKRNKAN